MCYQGLADCARGQQLSVADLTITILVKRVEDDGKFNLGDILEQPKIFQKYTEFFLADEPIATDVELFEESLAVDGIILQHIQNFLEAAELAGLVLIYPSGYSICELHAVMSVLFCLFMSFIFSISIWWIM